MLVRSTSLALIAVFLSAGYAVAAIEAMLSTTRAVPGDKVELKTVGVPGAYEALEQEGPLAVYLVPTSMPSGCGDPASTLLGKMQWQRGDGVLAFTVPAVPPGVYSFALETPQMRPSCWRIGPKIQPLSLTIGGLAPEANRSLENGQGAERPPGGDVGSAQTPLWLWVALAAAGLLGLAVSAFAVARRRV